MKIAGAFLRTCQLSRFPDLLQPATPAMPDFILRGHDPVDLGRALSRLSRTMTL